MLYADVLPWSLNDDAPAAWPLSPSRNWTKNVKLKPTKRSTAATQVSLRAEEPAEDLRPPVGRGRRAARTAPCPRAGSGRARRRRPCRAGRGSFANTRARAPRGARSRSSTTAPPANSIGAVQRMLGAGAARASRRGDRTRRRTGIVATTARTSSTTLGSFPTPRRRRRGRGRGRTSGRRYATSACASSCAFATARPPNTATISARIPRTGHERGVGERLAEQPDQPRLHGVVAGEEEVERARESPLEEDQPEPDARRAAPARS